jgi:hypothetical protein
LPRAQTEASIDIDATETGTRVTQRCEVRPPQHSPFARMVNDGMLENLRMGIEGNLGNLKGNLESAPAFA